MDNKVGNRIAVSDLIAHIDICLFFVMPEEVYKKECNNFVYFLTTECLSKLKELLLKYHHTLPIDQSEVRQEIQEAVYQGLDNIFDRETLRCSVIRSTHINYVKLYLHVEADKDSTEMAILKLKNPKLYEVLLKAVHTYTV